MFANKYKVHFSSILVVFLLSGCGLQPMYRKNTDDPIKYLISQTQINPIAGRKGQILYNSLLDKLNFDGIAENPKYFLDIKIQTKQKVISYDKDGTAQRFNTVVRANINMLDSKGKTLYKDCLERSSFFNVRNVFANFSYNSYSSQLDSEIRAIEIIAEDISLLIASYFKKWGK